MPSASNDADSLMVCVECGHPIGYIYKEYSRGNIRLGRCRKCRTTADRYVEYESALLFLDMMLHKVSVYRHLLVNRTPHSQFRNNQRGLPSWWKMLILFLGLDIYTKLYLHTIDQQMPSLLHHVWLPVVMAPSDAGSLSRRVFFADRAVKLLDQHAGLASIRLDLAHAASKAGDLCPQRSNGEPPAAAAASWNLREEFRCAGSSCSLSIFCDESNGAIPVAPSAPQPFAVNESASAALSMEQRFAVEQLADIGDAVWQLPNFSSTFWKFLVVAVVETAAFFLGALGAMRVFGILSHSRLRLDAATGLPRTPPPPRSIRVPRGSSSRLSYSSSAATTRAAPLATAAESVLPLLVSVMVPPRPAEDACDIGGISPIASAPVSPSRLADCVGASRDIDGKAARPPLPRLRRSISTGNTQAAEAVRRETAEGNRRERQSQRQQRGVSAVGESAASLPASPPPPVATGTSPPAAAAVVAAAAVATTAAPPATLLRTTAAQLLACAAAAVEFMHPSRPVIDAAPPTPREYAATATALLVASFARAFIVLSMVWNYPVAFLRVVTVFVLTSQATALQALCDCSLAEAAAVVSVAYCASAAATLLLWWLGLGVPSMQLR